MSLLIKALDKAEQATPTRRAAQNLVGHDESPSKAENANMERASNVFASKQTPVKQTSPMAWILGLGLLALLGIGAYFYYQLNQLKSPALPPAQPVSELSQTEEANKAAVEREALQLAEAEQMAQDAITAEATKVDEVTGQDAGTQADAEAALAEDEKADQSDAANTAKTSAFKPSIKQSPISKSRPKRIVNSTPRPQSAAVLSTDMFDAPAPVIASKSASIQIAKSRRNSSIQPELLDAYDAYNLGRNVDAKALYMAVLKRDIHNVDALLGMGAIAEREGRMGDALDWYQKVLAVEPRNPVALSAYYDGKLEAGNKEQKLKTLIAQQPQNANAHADLANYYADNQQWALAQQAYFDAYRLNANAENTLNLAVSLDQMGKSNIALEYYQEVLTRLDSTQQGIDAAAVEARIQAIQIN